MIFKAVPPSVEEMPSQTKYPKYDNRAKADLLEVFLVITEFINNNLVNLSSNCPLQRTKFSNSLWPNLEQSTCNVIIDHCGIGTPVCKLLAVVFFLKYCSYPGASSLQLCCLFIPPV